MRENPFKVGDVVRLLPDVFGKTTSRQLYCKHGRKDFYTVTSVNRKWVRVDGGNDGFSFAVFELHSNAPEPIRLPEELFTL